MSDDFIPVPLRLRPDAAMREAAPELFEALETLLTAFERFAAQANWARSAFDAETIAAVNSAPGLARAALAKARGQS